MSLIKWSQCCQQLAALSSNLDLFTLELPVALCAADSAGRCGSEGCGTVDHEGEGVGDFSIDDSTINGSI